jgi:Holliday junction resolvase
MNKSKRKGTAAETAVVGYLRENGFPHAERRALNGSTDRGDVAGVPGVVIEIKNCARMELAGWVDEARLEAANAGVGVFAVAHKRRGKGNPADWFVTLPLSVFCEVIR